MVTATLGVCGLYALMLFALHGTDLFRQTDQLIRLPFLFGVAVFFGTITEDARRERRRAEKLSEASIDMARRYRLIASERDRTQALLEIGRLALLTAPPPQVLHEITVQLRKTLGIDRCSLIVFNEGGREGYLAACTDDPDHEVFLLLPLKHYPELQETLESGEITEVHPGDDSELANKVLKHLPKTHRVRSSIVVPILQKKEVVGVFFLRDRRQDFGFRDDEKIFCSAAALMTAAYLQGCDLIEEMRRRSRLDGLTGLLNFNAFQKELADLIDGYTAREDPKPLSLVMVDIDDLKLINDRLGHSAGNLTIETVGKLLARALPTAPAICRYGGDEFIAVYRDSKDKTAERMERLLIGLENLADDALPRKPTVSIGIAAYESGGAEQFIEAADQAMYLAKSEGGNRISLTDDVADTTSWNGKIFEAVISVNARRLIPGESRAFRSVLGQLLRMEEKKLDSTAVQQSLQALMEAVESKDPYTNQHSHEVSDLARETARQLGMNDDETLTVEMAALVHDIGKIGIADEILSKPGKLDTRERLEIERHPEIGAQILRPLPALKNVVPLVLYHQERWDGSGYPEGLKGDEIPLGAQIVAVCDVFHALTSDRSYRKAFSIEKGREMIRAGIGTDWNETVAESVLATAAELERRVEQAEQREKNAQWKAKRLNRIA